MAVNSYGAVWLNDFGAPRVISGRARAVISGGQLVVASGATGVVSSGADSFATEDITFSVTSVSGADFTGVALATVGSNALLQVAVDGVFILQAIGTVTAGQPIAAGGDDSVLTTATAGHIIGRAFTTAASGAFAVVHVK
jgi:hypothetical protein